MRKADLTIAIQLDPPWTSFANPFVTQEARKVQDGFYVALTILRRSKVSCARHCDRSIRRNRCEPYRLVLDLRGDCMVVCSPKDGFVVEITLEAMNGLPVAAGKHLLTLDTDDEVRRRKIA
jgi:hypothetical protein